MIEKNDLEKRINELAMLNEIGRALSSTIKINDLMELIYQQTTRVMEVSAFYIALYMEKANQMMFIFDVLNDERQPDEERAREFGYGRTEYIIRNQKPLLIKSNPQKVYKELGIVSGDKKAKACAGVPMIYSGKSIGALVVQSYQVNEAYDQNHIDLLSTIASQAAIAIENARLFETLEERNLDLLKAKRETDNILNNVKEGLFLLNKNYDFESQYSKALENIFEEKNLANKSFPDYLKDKVSEEIYDQTIHYLEVVFDKAIEEDIIKELSPLSQVELRFKDPKKQTYKKSKYLVFDLKRVQDDLDEMEVIGTVTDVSEQIKLEKDLQESKERTKRQMEWMVNIINSDPVMLREYLKTSETELELVEDYLQKIESKTDFEESIDGMYRAIHSIKGNAALLELNFISEHAHAIEDFLVEVKSKNNLNISDSKFLHLQMDELKDIFKEVKNILDKISNIIDQFRPKRRYENLRLFNSLESLINSLGKSYNKNVVLDYKDFDGDLIHYKGQTLLRDILVQLTRNSLFHGIEDIKERKKKGKKENGTLRISNTIKNNMVMISFKDDGRGIQLDKLKKKALESGKWKKEEINKWNREQLTNVIFESGLSTSEKIDITAGRGVGMDIIQDKIKKASGKIEIDFKEDEYCEFKIYIPKDNKA